MALVSKLVAVGVPAKIANVVGDQFETLAALGNSLSTAAGITESLVYCNAGTAVTAFGLRLPTFDMSKTGHHTIFNESGITIRLYVADSSLYGIKGFGGVTAGGAGAYVDIADAKAAEIYPLTSVLWGAFGT